MRRPNEVSQWIGRKFKSQILVLFYILMQSQTASIKASKHLSSWHTGITLTNQSLSGGGGGQGGAFIYPHGNLHTTHQITAKYQNVKTMEN